MKISSRILTIFLIAFILAVIFHPKPLCSFTHTGGWNCSSHLPLVWLNDVTRQSAGALHTVSSTQSSLIDQEAGSDVVVALLIAILATVSFVVLHDLLLAKKFGNHTLVLLLAFCFAWFISRTIVGYPYFLFDLDSDWGTSSQWYRPIAGGYE